MIITFGVADHEVISVTLKQNSEKLDLSKEVVDIEDHVNDHVRRWILKFFLEQIWKKSVAIVIGLWLSW